MSDDPGKENDRTYEAGPSQNRGKLLRLADYELPIRPGSILGEIRSYWEGLRQGRAIPDRADIDPHGIRRVLDYTFILERIAPGAARFRLAGRHLIDLMGMEVRGMPLCALFNTTSRGRLSDVLESVFRGPQITEITLQSPASYGRPALEGRMTLLPLRSDLGDVTRALGCLAAEGQIGANPRRFDLLADRQFPVIPGARVLEPSPSYISFSEPPAPWTGPSAPQCEPTTPEARRARFRLIRNPRTPA
ncbi:PAS domain-containing protein [Paracoccus kondratievae]|uniref:PAS domain-containing protein n=1 Tax=Paracoccus TaxID=265 RepID=UPI000A0E149E|nr:MULTISPECIES: PAS domain-containing protein [Paracoccus]QFQ86739.1 PAS domain-containing protein [Paracoccus kondratievae]SMG38224.1 PAS domain-containing protein [Paracoccus sp. J56]